MLKPNTPTSMLAYALFPILLVLGCITGCNSGGNSSNHTYNVTNTSEAASAVTDTSSQLSFPADALMWSQAHTWSDAFPTSGNDVVIPSNKTIVLDTQPEDIKTLTVNGTLIIPDIRDLTINARAIIVTGKLQIGTSSLPFTHQLDITLTGDNPLEEIGDLGTKVLAAKDNGTIEIHGIKPSFSWTYLAKTAIAGNTTIMLQHAPDWRTGDQIVLSGTTTNPEQVEIALVRSVNGTTVQLAAPLAFTHTGDTLLPGNSTTTLSKAALLTHNIHIHGDSYSDQYGFGGHFIVQDQATAHIEGVEFSKMGQLNSMGRYPVQFNSNALNSTSYLRDSSIHDSYNRCVTVRSATNDVAVSNNVGFDVIGQCYVDEAVSGMTTAFTNNVAILDNTAEISQLRSRGTGMFITSTSDTSNTPLCAKRLIWTSEYLSTLTDWNIQDQWGAENVSYLDSPDVIGKVTRVHYPKGSYDPGSMKSLGLSYGGTGGKAKVLSSSTDCAVLSYKIRFADNFQFVQGGKLPGLYGGTGNSGGQIPTGYDGFSLRYMWGTDGRGEVYAYLPTSVTYGTSLGRGTFTFVPGKWHTIVQEVQLNNPNSQDGEIRIWLDGKRVAIVKNITFRYTSDLKIDGIFFETFFGGHDQTWATPVDTDVDFGDFKLWTN